MEFPQKAKKKSNNEMLYKFIVHTQKLLFLLQIRNFQSSVQRARGRLDLTSLWPCRRSLTKREGHN